MKTRISLTLSAATLAGVRRGRRRGESRSETIERLLRERLEEEAAHARGARDSTQINQHADALNAEAADVLAYQGPTASCSDPPADAILTRDG